MNKFEFTTDGWKRAMEYLKGIDLKGYDIDGLDGWSLILYANDVYKRKNKD